MELRSKLINDLSYVDSMPSEGVEQTTAADAMNGPSRWNPIGLRHWAVGCLEWNV